MLIRKNYRDHFFKNEWFILSILVFYLIDPMGYGCYSLLVLFPALLQNNAIGKNFDKNSVLLLCFSMTYVLFVYQYKAYYNVANSVMMQYLMFPLMMYCLGKYFQKKYFSDYSFYRITFFILIMFSVVAYISISFSIYKFGFRIEDRNVFMLNSSKPNIDSAATLVNSFIAPFLALWAIFFIPAANQEKKHRRLFLLFSFLSLLFSVRLGSRTAIVIFIASLVLNYFFLIKYCSSLKRKIAVSIIFAVVSIFLLNMSMEESDIFFAYQDRLESTDFGANTAGGRLNKWAVGIDNIMKYPMGVVAYKRVSYSHNLWLDIGRVAGIIPMFLMLAFSLRMLYVLLKVITIRSVSLMKRSVFLSLNIAFISVFAVEPIIEGNFTFLSVYFFFSGVLYAMYQQSKRTSGLQIRKSFHLK